MLVGDGMDRYREIFNKMLQYAISLDVMVYVLVALALIAIVIGYILFKDYVTKEMNKREYTIYKARRDYLISVVQFLDNSNKPYIKKVNQIIDFIGRKLSMLNSFDVYTNKKYAILLLIVLLVMLIGLFVLLMISEVVWYNVILVLIFEVLLSFIGIYSLAIISRASLLKQLPDTYTIIIMNMKKHTDLIDIIKESILEMKKGSLKRELIRLASSLEKNDPYELASTYKMIEENYHVQYLTILLVVLRHINKHGGILTARRELSYVQRKMRKEIQYQLDVAIYTRTFMIFITVINFAGLIFAKYLSNLLFGDNQFPGLQDTNVSNLKIPLMIVTVIILIINLGLQKAAD